MSFRKNVGRLTVTVSDEGAKMHDYGHGCEIACPKGWNDSCEVQRHTVSVEELRDLHYVLGRAIAYADEHKWKP